MFCQTSFFTNQIPIDQFEKKSVGLNMNVRKPKSTGTARKLVSEKRVSEKKLSEERDSEKSDSESGIQRKQYRDI